MRGRRIDSVLLCRDQPNDKPDEFGPSSLPISVIVHHRRSAHTSLRQCFPVVSGIQPASTPYCPNPSYGPQAEPVPRHYESELQLSLQAGVAYVHLPDSQVLRLTVPYAAMLLVPSKACPDGTTPTIVLKTCYCRQGIYHCEQLRVPRMINPTAIPYFLSLSDQ